MVPTSYTEVALFLLLALGAALFLGTGAALLRYRRTGHFPGEAGNEEPPVGRAEGGTADAEREETDRAQPTRAQVRAALVKCGVGAVLMVWALGTIIVQRGS